MNVRALLFASLVAFACQAVAHDSRPNFVEIIETDPGIFSVQWKVPASVPSTALPTIGMPGSCTTDARRATQQAGGAYVGRQDYKCPNGLSGQAISINFPILNPSLSTLFQVRLANGEQHVRVLKPDESEWIVPDAESKLAVAGQYTALGIEHIWIGIDHLLFVACLLLIARTARNVLITITGFTVAHSITLALAVPRVGDRQRRPVITNAPLPHRSFDVVWLVARPRICRGTERYWLAANGTTDCPSVL